ncbi:MAG TPA: integrase [Luteimonas sp.]
MVRGRTRRHNPHIPKHIDQARLPAGVYWDKRWGGTWYILARDPGGRQRRTNVADGKALLSDLHAIAEARAGKTNPKLLIGLCTAFEDSPQFKRRAPATRADYGYCRQIVIEHRTKMGRRFGDLETRKLKRPLIQLLIDKIAEGTERDEAGDLIPTPSKAAHVQRYLSRLFKWGANRGYCDGNPAAGIELPEERKRRRLPEQQTMARLVEFARGRAGTRGKAGSVAPYLAPAMELAYLLRLRGIEVITLADSHVLEEGVRTNRRKGSRDNVTAWTPELRAAVDELRARRSAVWEAKSVPVPMRAEDRRLVVNLSGQPLTKSGFDSAWQRLVKLAMAEGVLSEHQRFGAHDLKRRGITDTPGTRGEKQLASGHATEGMLDVYDYSVPVVQPAGSPRNKPDRT